MIITKTPYRISFAGGGTDLAAFYTRDYGAVVSTAIDKYIYIALHAFFEPEIVLKYSQTEHVDRVEAIRHPLIREVLSLCNIGAPIEITSFADIPSTGSGLASSSAFTVGLIKALHAHTGREIGPTACARMACEVEIERLAEPIGKQDQYAVAHGGFNYIRFDADGAVCVEPIMVPAAAKSRLQDSLMLFHTKIARSSRSVLEEQKSRLQTEPQTYEDLRRIRDLADGLRTILERGDVDGLGEVLHENWMLKRGLTSSVSTPAIDDWYDRARRAGAIGGKLLGAGGGGFLLFYCPPERQEAVTRELAELRLVDFRFEPYGTRTIYIDA